MLPRQPELAREWLVGGGETGDLIRTSDWSATPLGPRDVWPVSLRAVVNLVVASRFPMALLWGRDLIFIYNDAYRDIAGERHPRALGRSTREIWPEVWHINEPIFAAVMERGESVYLEDELFPIERRGRREEAYFTLCYSPVRIEDGTVGGTLVALQETTSRVAERKRLVADRERALETFEHGEACIVLDREYRIVLVNREQERLSAKPRSESLGRLLWEVWPDHADPDNPFRRAWDRAIRERQTASVEAFYETRSAWLDVRIHPTADGGAAAFFHDTTARRNAEESLRASEARFRALTLASSDVLYQMSPDWREMRNLSSGRFLAETVEPDSNWMEKYIHPDDRAHVQAAIDAAIRRGDTFELEHRVLARDGGVGWTSSRAIPLKDSAANIVEWFGIATDVTLRKRAEEALRASEADARARAAELERLAMDRKLALDAARMGWWHYDPATAIARYDERYTEIFGVAGRERPNEEILKLIHPDDLPRVWAAVEAALDPRARKRYVAEYRIRRPDGEERWIEAHGAATFEGEGSARRSTSLVGTVMDVTDRMRADETQRESERRFHVLADNSPVIMWMTNALGGIEFVNRAYTEFFGAIVEEVQGPKWQPLVHPDDHASYVEPFIEAVRARKPFRAAGRVLRHDGEWRWVDSYGEPRFSSVGEFLGHVGLSPDITDQKLAEERLRFSERLHRIVAEAGELGSRVTRPDDLVEAIGERVAKELGVSRCGFSRVDLDQGIVEVLKDYHGDLPSIAGTYPISEYMEHWREDGLARRTAVIDDVATHPGTAALYDAAFAPIQVRAHLTVPLHRGGRWVANFWASHHERRRWTERDVELMKVLAERVWAFIERSRAEESLREANQKLREADRRKDEFLGMLSHELRNPLAPIRNSLFVLDRAAPGSEAARRAREVAARQVAHLTRLLDDLLDVTRIVRNKIELRPADVDVTALVRRTAEDHHGLMHDRALELRVEVSATAVVVHGDETRLAQALGNLLQNAAKFTPRDGEVSVSVRVLDDQVEIRVRDTGAGIEPALLPHVFDPFVQAKQSIDRPEGGLGLGLALVKGVVELHGGAVSAASEGPGKGTEISVRLPLARPVAAVEGAPGRATQVAPSRLRVLETG